MDRPHQILNPGIIIRLQTDIFSYRNFFLLDPLSESNLQCFRNLKSKGYSRSFIIRDQEQ